MTSIQTFPLAGRVAVVTGASSGIGAATARRLAAAGAKVAVLARRADRLDALVDEIRRAGGTAIALGVDVTDAAAVHAAADRVAEELGQVDVLFNNAGVMLPAPVDGVPAHQWQQQIDLNVTGLMNGIGAFVPQLIKSAADKGVADLVNTSSIAAQNIFPNFAVYSGTKAFVTHMSRTLRAELGAKDIRVSTIEPGMVATELQDHVTDAGVHEWLNGARSQFDWLAPADVAEAVTFLVSQPARVNVQQLTLMPTRQAS
ncbi:SDR family oxidoreductase [Mycolicibacterium flavescens]|uniref:Short-chain dehydrogenase n=1 Tax=Mycolicibacterium flavescens TaxID=1776 RepID=A0A1E3RIF8_MYCFV|nr:SDR family oxidoreductase [Mycolicibacterium flavescens]MCV7282076.1 SDR family oxidoreductase [Mycolicibacterium flavescens]ODQ89651.1 short-chain dehydrogenase [Mycolicibacterium flavescens]